MNRTIKFLILTIVGIFIFSLRTVSFASSSEIQEVRYYDNLIKNDNVVTILLDKNTKSRKISKSELINDNKKIQNIKDSNGKELKNNSLVKTGDLVTINNKDYKVVLYGDINEDGYICDIDDIIMVQNSYLGKTSVNSIQKLAGNLKNTDNTLDIEDIIKMINTYLGQLFENIVTKLLPGNIDFNNNQNNQQNEDKNSTENESDNKVENGTPVAEHGKLNVEGTNIIDKNGKKFQIKGVSTHGLQWFPQYVNQEAFTYMRDKWGINAIRLAMYSDPNVGYTTKLHETVDKGVKYATNSGIYAIIDWHILSDGNPNTNKQAAIAFFKEMATKYKDNNNVLYEICNEPNGDVQWQRDIKPYAEEVIKEIRNIDDDAIIIVGTPTWSQDVDVVAQNPIKGYKNIMYTLHFYAATHKQFLRDKAQTALNSGLPLFVTEFGICDASGNGAIDVNEANTWIDYLNKNNISWMCWSLSNKEESASILKNTNKTTDWTTDELSDEGKWLLEALKR